jgi:NADPH-dependent curcumin reductase CurA
MSVAASSSRMNRQFRLAARPVGMPKESDFALVETMVSEPRDGQVLAKAIYISVDPYMRSKMNDASPYPDPIDIGDTMVGLGIGRVIESQSPAFAAGDLVLGEWGWQEYVVADGGAWLRLPPSAAPVSTKLGVLGMSGITAYFGLLEVCQPKAGDTVVISGAAGAVGSLAGQIAKITGCRTIGIAGTDAKVEYLLNEL